MDKILWGRAAEVFGSDLGKKLRELTSAMPGVRLGAEELFDGAVNPAVLTAMEALVHLGIARKAEWGVIVLSRDLIDRLEDELRPLVLPSATPRQKKEMLEHGLGL
ncbi:hypothetical protein [Pseudomonas aeruginosa]